MIKCSSLVKTCATKNCLQPSAQRQSVIIKNSPRGRWGAAGLQGRDFACGKIHIHPEGSLEGSRKYLCIFGYSTPGQRLIAPVSGRKAVRPTFAPCPWLSAAAWARCWVCRRLDLWTASAENKSSGSTEWNKALFTSSPSSQRLLFGEQDAGGTLEVPIPLTKNTQRSGRLRAGPYPSVLSASVAGWSRSGPRRLNGTDRGGRGTRATAWRADGGCGWSSARAGR